MNFSQAFKVFQLNVLRQAGISVTPQQLGLKSDPIADLQAKSAASGNSPFASILNGLGGASTTGSNLPVPPTPPTDPLDATAQAQYNKDLLAYQQSYQAYNQQMMNLVLARLNQIQQSINLANQQQTRSQINDRSVSSIGIGGILGGEDS